MAIVPTDPVARRRVRTQHFLNDTGAGTAAGGLGLGYNTFPDCKGHAHSLMLVIAQDSPHQPFATTTGGRFADPGRTGSSGAIQPFLFVDRRGRTRGVAWDARSRATMERAAPRPVSAVVGSALSLPEVGAIGSGRRP